MEESKEFVGYKERDISAGADIVIFSVFGI
jgi:hypothetical protein